MLLCAQIKLTWTSEESKSWSVDRYFMWSYGWIVSYNLQQCSFSLFLTNMHLYKYILRLFKHNTDIGVHLYSRRPPLTPAVQQAWGGQQLAQSPYFIFFFYGKSCCSKWCPFISFGLYRAAVFKLWPEVVNWARRWWGRWLDASGRVALRVKELKYNPSISIFGKRCCTLWVYHTNISHHLIHGGSNRVLLTDQSLVSGWKQESKSHAR